MENHRIPLPPHTLLAFPPESSKAGERLGKVGRVFADTSRESGGFYYIKDFITEEEEQLLLEKVRGAPLPKWKTLQNRRLQYWGGQLTAKGTLIPQPLPEWLSRDIPSRLRTLGAFKGSKHGTFNHCLVNEYKPGQGINPHEDGPSYYDEVVTVSLGSHTLLDVYRWAAEEGVTHDKESGPNADTEASEGAPPQRPLGARAREPTPVFSILQEPRSLLISRGWAYRDYLHGIAERSVDGPSELRRVVNATLLGDDRLRDIVKSVQKEAMEKERSGEEAAQTTDGDAEAVQTDGVQQAEKEMSLARDTRISLTLRDVERVSKGLGDLLERVAGVK